MHGYEFFHGGAGKHFNFFQLPEDLVFNDCFKELSTDAKVLYAFTKTATKEITSTKRKMETARTNCWRLFLSPFLPSEKPFASIIFFDFSMGVSDIFIMASPPESYNAPIICMIAKETKEKPVENLKDSEHVQVKHIGSAFLKRQASYR